MNERQGRLVTFGLGGHCIYMAPRIVAGCRSTSSLQGYSDPEHFELELERGRYSDTELEGCPVMDARSAYRVKPSLALHSPLVSTELEGDSIDRLGDDAGDSMVAQAWKSGAYGGTAAIIGALTDVKAGEEPGPLDSVSVATYLGWFRRHAAGLGVRFGSVQGSRIVWE